MGHGSSRDAPGSRKVRSCSGSRPGMGRPSVKDRFLGSACLRSRQNEGNSGRIVIKPCTVELGQSSLTCPKSAKQPQVNFSLSSNFTRLAEDNRENMSESQMDLLSNCSFSIPCGEEVNTADRMVDISSSTSCAPNEETVTGAASSASAVASNTNSTGGVVHFSQTNLALSDILGVGHSQRQPQEPLENTARFRRSRSVDRLRNRVVRRTLLSEERSGAITTADEAQGYDHQDSMMQLISGSENVSSIDENIETTSSMTRHLSSMSRSTGNSHNPDSEVTTSRDNDSLDYRLAFLERRRRIRSQVRALQRLSTRFESLSGHERSCILSGQHRTGRCPCRTMTRSINSGDDTTTRAGISRIVVLAEALFEVLDEIHQQAVVLSSRPSLSSIGAVPAPKEVVDCMPVKLFEGLQKCPRDEAAQCYICLVEYEEGDCLRILPCRLFKKKILPCRHEFHQACVDKWLKEVHRVCPLCRGDVCISEVIHVEGQESST